MAPESLYLIILESLVASVIATYGTVPYGQYAGPYFSGYVYPAQSYTTKPAPSYQQYSPPGPYQPVYAPEAPKPSSIPAYQPVYATPEVPNPPSYAAYQPVYATPEVQNPPSSYGAYQPIFTLPGANPSYSSYQPIFAPASPPQASSPSPSQPYPPISPASYAYQQVYKSPPTPTVQTPVPSIESVPFLKESPLKPKSDLSTMPPFDTNVLNNLAIALQLLIVSNLIHNPPLDSNPVSNLLGDSVPIAPLSIPYIPPEAPKPYAYENQYDPNVYYSMPNVNFLGTTGFGDSGISKSMMTGYGSPTLPTPRPLGLMSPYDAIATNSYADSKKEPKSPYHLSTDYKDLFSLTELFKV